ncbi:MAG: LysM peptidoglycan-binding domain-containing protein [Caldilinea sp.]|nr:LysM peptidoglycan-binding domain-containing protein [Caldilinea sp.]
MKHPIVFAGEAHVASSTPLSAAHFARASVRLVAAWIALLAAVWLAQPAHAQDNVHVVSGGENLSTIARRYGMTMQELAAYNGIVNPNLVYVGQQIQIPGSGQSPQALAPATSAALPGEAGYHVVARGETLSGVAKAYGMTSGDLMRLNGISNANFIWVGQKLRVSARVDPVVAATERAAKPALADDIYVVQAGDTLAAIAAANQTTVQALLTANGLPNPNFVWVGQKLRVKSTAQGTTLSLVAAPAEGKRWIEVDLTNQTLTAWQGDVPVMFTNISSGRSNTPTVTGRFTVGTKYAAQRMTGPGYDLPNVPWVMYFHGSYAIHGAYWHNNFGVPMSHGCVNMRPGEAEMLYNWAAAGTEVYVHY